ncbi:MAG: hypothetical protein ABJ045_03795 [Alteripontixanthobacter sp.]|uniref:hypothetical protein n=1 Tax=Parasphingorhabdus sp. TaxID=2709688 RepID=UPI0032980AAE
MFAAAAFLMLAQSAAPADSPPVAHASAHSSVKIVRATRIDIGNAARGDTQGAQIARDEAGKLWIEFS